MDDRKPRVSAQVALTLLEAIQALDVPDEVLRHEDPTVTMPRRLGLSGVVDAQVRRYREGVRRGAKVPDSEVGDLVRLVIRRPDSPEVMLNTGRLLATRARGRPPLISRFLPDRARYWMARRRVRRGLRALFGRRLGAFASGRFTLEGRAHLMIQNDPGGDGCALVTGYCEGVLAHTLGRICEVEHVSCQARGDQLCRWYMIPPKEGRAGREP